MNWTSERWFDKLWIYAVLAAGILLFWWRIWTPSPADVMHFTDDILIKDYPTRLGLFRTLLSGHLPLWDPYQFGGWPGIANCEAGFFYPFNWLLLPFVQTPQAAFQVSQLLVLFHLFIAGVGAYRLGRIVGLSPTGAVMTAVVFTFCGFHCAHKKHTNMLFALVWLPWLMGLVEQWVRRDRIQPLLRMALLLAMVHLAGHPQASLYITLVLAARLLQAAWLKAAAGGPRRFRVLVKAGGGGLLLLAFSVALAAIQWAPTWELIRQSERSEANQYQRSSEFSMPPYELADLLLPEIVYPESQVEVFYWGIIPLVLAFVTLVTTRWDAFTGYLVALMGFSILLALGDFLFVFDLSYLLVPGMAWVRAPSRLIYFATLPSALLAGKAVHDWLANPRLLVQSPSVGLTRRAFQVGMGIACGIAALYYPMVDLASRRQIVSELMILFLFAGGALLLLSLARHQKISATGLGVLLIVLAWLDLGSQYRMQDLAPGPGGYAMDWEIRRLQQMPWVQRTKVFFDGGGNRELYHGAAQGFPELDGQSPLTPALSWEIRQDTALDAYKRPNRVLLDLFGVNAILTDMVDRVPPGFQRESSRLFVSEALPARARLFQEILPCDPETQQGILTMQTFPFGEVALVDGAPIEERASQSGLFPKPFFLASVSGNGLQAGACLVVDGINHFAQAQRQAGYFMAVADPQSGAVVKVDAFDLNQDFDELTQMVKDPAIENYRMREFLEQIPEGHLVMAAISDNASNMLLDETFLALRSIGARLDVRKQFRLAHLIIGRKGAPLGSALELIDREEAFVLDTGSLYRQHGARPTPDGQIHTPWTHMRTWYNLLARYGETAYTPLPIPQSDTYGREYPGFILPTAILVYSAPKKKGIIERDFASIWINGREVGQNRRGYNVVVLHPQTGEVIASEVFDMTTDWNPLSGEVKNPPPENTRMRDLIESVPEGWIILGAIRDEAIDLLQPEAVQALRSLGSTLTVSADPDQRKRYSHAFLAVKGKSYCIESYGQDRDAILFSRLEGEPNLESSQLLGQGETSGVSHPMEELEDRSTPMGQNAAIAVQDEGPNRFSVNMLFPQAGHLFVNEVFYPGWRVSIDGQPQAILRTNYYFRGTPIPAGLHKVEWVYAPPLFRYGCFVTVFSLLVFVVAYGRVRRAERQSQAAAGVVR